MTRPVIAPADEEGGDAMTLELLCRECHAIYNVSRVDLTKGVAFLRDLPILAGSVEQTINEGSDRSVYSGSGQHDPSAAAPGDATPAHRRQIGAPKLPG
jgi:hypothetical protein